MENQEHLSSLTDVQIQERIANLTEFQRKVFLENCAPGVPVRHALFIATSWPENVQEKGDK